MTKKPSTRWSDMELEVAVDAYLDMLQMEKDSRPFKKTEIGLMLREGALSARSKSAIELRMQNISSVMVELGLRRIKGYVPAKNVGAKVRVKIQEMLNRKGVSKLTDYIAQTDATPHDQKTEESLTDFLDSPPPGTKKPKASSSTVVTYDRDSNVRDWVFKNAKGKCEGCGQAAPFLDTNGSPFLEVHHVRRLADKGSDRPTNAVALCPNCHRRCHSSEDREAFTASFYTRLNRLEIENPDVPE
jgi:5-methylcytosine-specific restriction protein A